MGLAREDQPHEFVIVQVELDLVDPMAEPIVGPWLGSLAVGQSGEVLDLRRADMCAGTIKSRPRPLGPKHLYPLGESGSPNMNSSLSTERAVG